MTARIHPTAIIDKTAELTDGVTVEAYATIGPRIRIGAGTRVRAHAAIVSDTTIGSGCDIHSGAVVGGDPQDTKYKGEATKLVIGNDNIIRECVTINRGTALGGGETVLGDRNLLMAYAHVAHDCILGNECILTNGVQLAGHIRIEDMAIISGLTGVHHFCTIGTMSFVAGLSAVRTDVPPYMIVEGNPARVRKLNTEGLKRRGILAASIQALKGAFRIVYRSELTRAEAIRKIESAESAQDPCVRNLIEHYRASESGCQGRASEAFRTDKKQTENLV